MAVSIITYTADGSTNQFSITFDYISQSHVVVTVDGTSAAFTFINTSTVQLNSTPSSGSKVQIQRVTPVTAIVDFTDGSTLFEADLDLADKQSRFISEEAKDIATDAKTTIDNNIADVNTVAGNSADISTVAGVSSSVSTVAGIAANVTTAAGNTTNINTVAANDANITAVGGISSNVTTVAGISGDVTAVANDATDIGVVGSNISAVTTAASNISAIQNASANAATATTKASEASSSAGAALVSQNAAAASQTAAAASETAAGTSETNAATSATAASNSASAAATSASNAATSESNASTSQGAAATSATNAATSAATATTKAGEASTSATNAATSETNAGNSSTAAASSASAAATSETNAANSAAAAAAAFDNFDDTYLGSKTSDPTVDNDGNALVSGALYFNSAANEMRVYDGANWIAASSAGTASLLEYKYTATAGQTTFSGTDDNSATLSYSTANLILTLNGIVLENGTDYTATSGTSIVLTVGAAAGDELNVIAFKSFTATDMVSATTGGTFNGNVTVNGTLAATTFSGVTTVPIGGIIMFSGTISSLDAAWAICDGTNGTPNLTDTFVMGTATQSEIGDTGGSADAIVVNHTHSASTNSAGNHSHTGSTSSAGNHRHSATSGSGTSSGGRAADTSNSGATIYTNYAGAHTHSFTTNSTGSHSHTVTVNGAGSSGTNANLPPYYKLAYIMRVS